MHLVLQPVKKRGRKRRLTNQPEEGDTEESAKRSRLQTETEGRLKARAPCRWPG